MQIILENDLHLALSDHAKRNRRSLNQHILWLLEQAVIPCAESTKHYPPVLAEPTKVPLDVLSQQIDNFFATETLELSESDALQTHDSFIDNFGTRWLVLDDFLMYLRKVNGARVHRVRVIDQLLSVGWHQKSVQVTDVLSNTTQELHYYCQTKQGNI